MKKFISLLLVMCLALSLVACSSSTGTTSTTASSSATASTGAIESEAELSADASTALTNQSVEVSNIVANDGTILVEREISAPTLTFANADAQKAVEADLAKLYEQFDKWTQEIAEFAKEDLAYRADSSTSMEYEFEPYYGALRITTARVDDTVMSLVVDYEGYSGGAHGWDNRFTRNYDATTGERITFEQLGDSFRSKAEELVLAQADTIAADSSEFIFFDDYEKEIPYVVADGTEKTRDVLEKVYGSDAVNDAEEDATLDPMFYFSDDGMVFIAGQYVMKSYAAGIIEFTIPYADFGDSLNSAYVK